MRWLLCYIFPPAAVLFCGKPFSAILNFFLTCLLWFPGVAHARWVLDNHLADNRSKRVVRAVNRPEWVDEAFPRQPRQRRAPRRQLVEAAPEPELIDDPAVGPNGTVFRRRSR